MLAFKLVFSFIFLISFISIFKGIKKTKSKKQKKAFLSLELIFSILILGLVFSFSYKLLNQSYKNSENMELISLLYTMEKKLLKKEIKANIKSLNTNLAILNPLSLKERKITLKGLNLSELSPKDDSYKASFTDEKSF